MINLLPTESKRQLKAARTNTIIVRYIVVLIIAGIFANIIIAGSYFLLSQSKSSQELLIDANSNKAQAYSKTQSEITRLTSTLSSAKPLLEEQMLTSLVLKNISSSLLPGTVLEKIELTTANLSGTPMTIKVFAKDSQTAGQLRAQMASLSYFKDVTIDSVSETGGITGYPASATITLTLTRQAGQ